MLFDTELQNGQHQTNEYDFITKYIIMTKQTTYDYGKIQKIISLEMI